MYSWLVLPCYIQFINNIINKREKLLEECSKSFVKDLVYKEPFGFRVVHNTLLTFFL